MIHFIHNLIRYRELILTLVGRELQARYRGTLLGYFWSLINPLLLLTIYTVVFSTIFQPRMEGIRPYAMFLFCGLLPWTWFSGSLLESTIVLPDNAQLIKKVLFPTEILPITKVVSHGVHFVLALPILVGALLWTGNLGPEIFLLPVPLLLQFLFTTGIALTLSALSVHFRDLRDLMQNLITLWFFATPIIYPLDMIQYPLLRRLIHLNPATPLFIVYQDLSFFHRFPRWTDLAAAMVVSLVSLLVGVFLFERLKETLMEEA
ncbi:MAG TPA: ABC transporter permease [Thermoanaerobaculia bacterium]|nr:ABC transporter permease [Thermoanaerobaculia bacterium]HUM29472.1 ABC transporter permease [Thermoanaerobaculia bacterium]HXK67855.1 ABC transporter permease [Thermoanaerobaculia bacterium]